LFLGVLVPCCVATAGLGNAVAPRKVWLSDLDIRKTQQGWEHARKDLSVDGQPLKIAGRAFEKGLGTHADSVLYVELNGGSTRFHAWVGVDDEVMNPNRPGGAQPGSVEFRILADGQPVYKSGMIRSGDPAKEVDLDVTGVTLLVLIVDSVDDMNYDHADWAEAFFTVTGAAPKTLDAPKEEAVILTPKPSPAPRINSARVFGVRPGSPVLYTIAASGLIHHGWQYINIDDCWMVRLFPIP